jgi:hypothetical protein
VTGQLLILRFLVFLAAQEILLFLKVILIRGFKINGFAIRELSFIKAAFVNLYIYRYLLIVIAFMDFMTLLA